MVSINSPRPPGGLTNCGAVLTALWLVAGITLPSSAAAPTAGALVAPPVPAKPPAPASRLQPRAFANTLAARPRGIVGGDKPVTVSMAWAAIASSTPDTRQSTRWDLVNALLARRAGADALGVLHTMELAEPALAHVPVWRLAMAQSLHILGRGATARDWLNAPELLNDPDACALHILAGAPLNGADGSRTFKCALPAIRVRRGKARTDLLIATAQSLLRAGHGKRALALLSALPADNHAADLLRGEALIASDTPEQGIAHLRRVYTDGAPGDRAMAELLLIQDAVARQQIKPRSALKRLKALAFRWRGDAVERRSQTLIWTVADQIGDRAAALAASAALFRYFDHGTHSAALLDRIHAQLQAVIDDPKLPVAKAAGLFWDYRDLSPGGGQGDALVFRLSDRLANAGLEARAAELLQHQLYHRAEDIAKGPLSIRIARLLLRADRNEQVLNMLRASEGPDYPPDIITARIRMEAIATFRSGRPLDAVAMIDPATPGGAALRAEMLWMARDWDKFAIVNQPLLRAGNSHAVLRQAIALMMLRDEHALAALRRSYLPGLGKSKAAIALNALASPNGAAGAAAIDAAMAQVSVPSEYGDLLLLSRS